jgi:hypothetical protein
MSRAKRQAQEDMEMRPATSMMVGVGVCCLLLALPAAIAHHSFSAYYDDKTAVSIKGTVTDIQWVNPHVFAHIAVKKGNQTEDWTVELGYINSLVRSGWTRERVKAGDVITITGPRGKAGVGYLDAKADPSGLPRLMRLREAEFSDGSKLSTTPQPAPPTK